MKIDETKMYKVKFKNSESEESAWGHIHCEICPDWRHNLTLDGAAERLNRRLGIGYHLMSLYRVAIKGKEVPGRFLASCERLDPGCLKYYEIS